MGRRGADGDLVQERVMRAVDLEVKAFRADALSSPTSGRADGDNLQSNERLAVWKTFKRALGREPTECARSLLRLLDAWDLNDASEEWRNEYQEQWRRLLVRLAVAGLIAQDPRQVLEDGASSELCGILQTAAASAVVARERLATYVIKVMRGGTADHELEPHEVVLAIFLLGRGEATFTLSECLPSSLVARRQGHRVLDTFRTAGIVERLRMSSSWKLTDTALAAINNENVAHMT